MTIKTATQPMPWNRPRLRFIEGAPEGEAAQHTEVTSEPAEVDYKAKFEEVLRESRKWESRAKENSTAAARLAEIEEAQKTEQQKLTERAEKAERELMERGVELARKDAVIKHGIPAEYADLVNGRTPEELDAAAEKIAGLVNKPAQKPSGVVPTIGQEPDRKSANVPLPEQIAAAEAAGDFKKAGALKALQLGTK